MFFPSGDQTGKSFLTGSNVSRVLFPRSTSSTQISRFPGELAELGYGDARSVRRQSRHGVCAGFPDSANRLTLRVKPCELHWPDGGVHAVNQYARLRDGEHSVGSQRVRTYLVSNPDGIAAQFHTPRVERPCEKRCRA